MTKAERLQWFAEPEALSRIGYHVFVVVKVVMDHPWVHQLFCQESVRLHVVVRSISVFNDG